ALQTAAAGPKVLAALEAHERAGDGRVGRPAQARIGEVWLPLGDRGTEQLARRREDGFFLLRRQLRPQGPGGRGRARGSVGGSHAWGLWDGIRKWLRCHSALTNGAGQPLGVVRQVAGFGLARTGRPDAGNRSLAAGTFAVAGNAVGADQVPEALDQRVPARRA